jgi:hypothetical protein
MWVTAVFGGGRDHEADGGRRLCASGEFHNRREPVASVMSDSEIFIVVGRLDAAAMVA